MRFFFRTVRFCLPPKNRTREMLTVLLFFCIPNIVFFFLLNSLYGLWHLIIAKPGNKRPNAHVKWDSVLKIVLKFRELVLWSIQMKWKLYILKLKFLWTLFETLRYLLLCTNMPVFSSLSTFHSAAEMTKSKSSSCNWPAPRFRLSGLHHGLTFRASRF